MSLLRKVVSSLSRLPHDTVRSSKILELARFTAICILDHREIRRFYLEKKYEDQLATIRSNYTNEEMFIFIRSNENGESSSFAGTVTDFMNMNNIQNPDELRGYQKIYSTKSGWLIVL